MLYWSVWVSVLSLLAAILTHWVYKWRHPKCNGKLPPGSMGLPLIGETLQFFVSSKSIDVSHFIKTRVNKYGPLFCTNLAGRPIVVSSDPEFNYFIFQQEGKLVELWYLDSLSRIVGTDSATASNSTAHVHKYLRNLVLGHFGNEVLKDHLLPKLENMIRTRLQRWSEMPVLELKDATSQMIFEFTAKQLFSYDVERAEGNISKKFTNFLQVLMSFPLNIPGTTFYKCLKNQKEAIKLMKEILEERRNSPENRKEDFLQQVVDDMGTEKFLTDDFVVHLMFGLLLASFETISSTLTLAIILLSDHPSVVQQLTEEHEEIIKNRENPDHGVSWKEYKSMTFTHHVTQEALRLASVAPGIMRKVLQDIKVNGYTIPAGWTIMVVPAVIQLNPKTYDDPLTFNPARWKDMAAGVTAKNFIAFGGGSRSCTGAEFSRVLMAVFFHVLVTNYRWTKIKGGEVMRTPVLAFENGFHMTVSKKHG